MQDEHAAHVAVQLKRLVNLLARTGAVMCWACSMQFHEHAMLAVGCMVTSAICAWSAS